MTPQLAADLDLVRQGRFFFSHHSVGADILSGVKRLDAEAGGRLRIVALGDSDAASGPALVHGSGGQNTVPRSKLDYFEATIRAWTGQKPDVAFMKFCYVDFNPGTDVDELFAAYRRTMEAVKRERPEVRLAHVTVPLFARPTDLKSSARRLLGLGVWEDDANAKRAEFNRRLREAFASDPILDVAVAEATGPDGIASTFALGGHTYLSLHSAYTTDGGHLNLSGQRAVGAAAIRFLADTIRGRPDAR